MMRFIIFEIKYLRELNKVLRKYISFGDHIFYIIYRNIHVTISVRRLYFKLQLDTKGSNSFDYVLVHIRVTTRRCLY